MIQGLKSLLYAFGHEGVYKGDRVTWVSPAVNLRLDIVSNGGVKVCAAKLTQDPLGIPSGARRDELLKVIIRPGVARVIDFAKEQGLEVTFEGEGSLEKVLKEAMQLSLCPG